MEDDSNDMDDYRKMTASIWKMTVSIRKMTVSMWDILSLLCLLVLLVVVVNVHLGGGGRGLGLVRILLLGVLAQDEFESNVWKEFLTLL